MKNARELLTEFTAASFRDPKKAAEMFIEDGAFEMPYLESLGVPGRYGIESGNGTKELAGTTAPGSLPRQRAGPPRRRAATRPES